MLVPLIAQAAMGDFTWVLKFLRGKSMLRDISRLAVAAALMATSSGAFAEKRALVIGVNIYDNLGPDRQLEKAVNDARAIGKTFESLGFKVEKAENVDRRGFNEAWSQFLGRVEPRDIAVFQFSGHGIEIDGANYLALRDAPAPKSNGKTLMVREFVAVDGLLRELQERGPQVSFLILDACRNNPFEAGGKKAFGGERGLARVDPPRGSFVMMSAGARQTALDRLSGRDSDPNSVYTRNLLPLLKKPGLSLADVAQDVRSGVEALAGSVEHEQTPAYYDQLTAKFYLAGENPGSDGTGKAADVAALRDQVSRLEAALKAQQDKPSAEAAALKEELAKLRADMKQQTALVTPPPPPPVEKPAKPVVGVFTPQVGETFRDCRRLP